MAKHDKDKQALIDSLREKAVAEFERGIKIAPGMCVGLPEGWRHSSIPLDVSEDYRRRLRMKLEAAGYVPCDTFEETAGAVIVGSDGAEIWVTPEEAYRARFALKKQRNDEKLAELRGEARKMKGRGGQLQTPLERMRVSAR